MRRGGPPRHPIRHPGRRLVGLLLVFLLLFGIVVGRLVFLQVVGPERYVAFGESQRVRSLTLAADRGSLFDRNGNDLAVSIPQRTIWADPKLVSDPVAEAAALAPILGTDAFTLQEKLSRPSEFVYLARRVSDDVADRVEELDLDGIYLVDEPTRFTPSGDLARGLLGTVGVDNDGLAGLELQYDDLLTGRPGEIIMERDPTGRTIAAGQRRVEPAQRGSDLVLTLDRSFQFEAERVLARQVAETGADGGTVIVSRPSTGEILALANVATDPETGEVASTGNNMAVTAVFEPGSVNKMITLAGALEDGLITPETQIEVPDSLQIYDYEFKDHDPHPTQAYTVRRILAESLNIGTIKIGQQLGRDRIDHYLRAFGFGTETALDFPNESAGIMLDPEDWSGTSIGSIPIGNGIAVTPMQMLAAYNAIANGGEYVPPRVVLAEVDERGERRPVAGGPARRVVSEETAAAMRSMLAEVVSDGTGEAAALDGYSVAGKTGTARKPQATGTYRDAQGRFHYVATFAGFVPAEHPELSIIVVIDEPSSSIYGGSVSAPVFADLARYGMRWLRIPPTETATADGVDANDTGSDAADEGEEAGDEARAEGDRDADGRVRARAASADDGGPPLVPRDDEAGDEAGDEGDDDPDGGDDGAGSTRSAAADGPD